MTGLFAFSVINMGVVKLSMDKYLMAIYLSLGKYKLCYFHTPDLAIKPHWLKSSSC